MIAGPCRSLQILKRIIYFLFDVLFRLLTRPVLKTIVFLLSSVLLLSEQNASSRPNQVGQHL